MRNILRAGALVLSVIGCRAEAFLPAQPTTPTCTTEDERTAEGLASTARSWRELHQQFARFSHCDDGAIAEGFSEAVTLLLSAHWRDVRRLETTLRADPAFRKFVVGHIDATVPASRLRQIMRNAKTRCPRDLQALCRDIEDAARDTVAAEPK